MKTQGRQNLPDFNRMAISISGKISARPNTLWKQATSPKSQLIMKPSWNFQTVSLCWHGRLMKGRLKQLPDLNTDRFWQIAALLVDFWILKLLFFHWPRTIRSLTGRLFWQAKQLLRQKWKILFPKPKLRFYKNLQLLHSIPRACSDTFKIRGIKRNYTRGMDASFVSSFLFGLTNTGRTRNIIWTWRTNMSGNWGGTGSSKETKSEGMAKKSTTELTAEGTYTNQIIQKKTPSITTRTTNMCKYAICSNK